jgi:hypothetical protein
VYDHGRVIYLESIPEWSIAQQAQCIRFWAAKILDAPFIISDMDMLPTNSKYYCSDLDHFQKDDFIYYRHIDPKKQIYMCYNAAHPSVWKKVFNINSKQDIINRINETYQNNYNGIPGSTGWFIDQEIMYNNLINYPHLKDVLSGYIDELNNRYNYSRDIKYWEWVFLRNFNLFQKKSNRILVPCCVLCDVPLLY